MTAVQKAAERARPPAHQYVLIFLQGRPEATLFVSWIASLPLHFGKPPVRHSWSAVALAEPHLQQRGGDGTLVEGRVETRPQPHQHVPIPEDSVSSKRGPAHHLTKYANLTTLAVQDMQATIISSQREEG